MGDAYALCTCPQGSLELAHVLALPSTVTCLSEKMMLHGRIVKLVRALRKGWIKRDRTPKTEEPPSYLLWQDDGMVADRPSSGAAFKQ